MAKTFIGYILALFLCINNYSCVSENGRTDTDSTSAVGKVFIPDSVRPNISADTIKCNCPETKNSPSISKPVVIVQPSYDQFASAVRQVYTSQIGVRELSDRNDGREVEMYLRSVGLSKGNPWCAAFVHYCLSKGGVPNSITGYSPTSFNKKNVVMFNHVFTLKPHYADVLSFYYPAKNRIAHTGFFDKDLGNGIYESVEGNTGDNGAIGNIVREGDGVYRKKRSYNSTYAISRHIKKNKDGK